MIFDGIYDLLTTTVFNMNVPYADMLATLVSGACCLGLIYLCFTPIIAIFKMIFKV